MKPSVFLASAAAALLLSPVLVSAQPQDTPPNPPMPRRQGPGGPGGQMQHPGAGPTGMGQAHMGMGMGMMQKRQSMKEALGLTDAQQADLRKVRETAQRDRLRKRTDLKIAAMDLKSLMRADKVDDKAIAAKLAELQAAQGALLKIRVDGALAMKRILTPEQQKKAAAMRDHRGGARMGQRMKRHGGMGAGEGRGRMARPMGRGGMRGGAADDDSDDDAVDIRPDGTVVR